MEPPIDINNIFSVRDSNFDDLAIELYHWQYRQNPVYRQWVSLLTAEPYAIKTLAGIPALPISFFKTHRVLAEDQTANCVFESSRTTGMVSSKHYVPNTDWYEKGSVLGFEQRYGKLDEWCVLALLPAYLERENSSLVYMANHFIEKSAHPSSGFYLYDFAELHKKLLELEAAGQKTLLLGVTFALLDFTENYPMQLNHTLIMETGGMKGRGKELTREELHSLLCKRTGLSSIHAEYGMTELLSQAYSMGGGRFHCPPWMKVLLRKEDDPLEIMQAGTGLLQIIDLANIYSCAFIATQDIGKLYPDGSFEVIGRMDHSDLRGCSLLVV